MREAWYGRAGAWNPAALSDLQERFSQWRMEEGARLEVTDQASGLPMLALKVSAIRQSLSDLMLQVTALEASISSLLSEDAQAGDGGSSPDV